MSKNLADKTQFLTPVELAKRWNISTTVLYLARKQRIGVNYIQFNGRGSTVLYRLSDVEKYEQKHYIPVDSDILLPPLKKVVDI